MAAADSTGATVDLLVGVDGVPGPTGPTGPLPIPIPSPVAMRLTAPLSTVQANHDVNVKAVVVGIVTGVEVSVNGLVIGTDAAPDSGGTYTVKWRVPKFKGARYLVSARALGVGGGTLATASITVMAR